MKLGKDVGKQIGERLQIAREAKGWTLDFASDFALITPVSLSRYEPGKRIPNAEILRRLCIVYGVSADWILGIKGLKGGDLDNDRF